ncbi:MAG: hypothetical protein ACR2HK_03355 [Gemmatimonadales bacterium]
MTYTFKLARRLAISQHLGMLTILLLAACAGESTAPDGSAPPDAPPEVASLRVTPRTITIETNQPVVFRSAAETPSGDSLAPLVAWNASGGSINPDGTFTSDSVGTFMVIAATRPRARDFADAPVARDGFRRLPLREPRADTSLVRVVPRPRNLLRLAVSPDTATVARGATRTFTVMGRNGTGVLRPVGVTWEATGGVIDPAGVYTAGESIGTHRVIATSVSRTLADTAIVVIVPTGGTPDPDSIPQPDPTPDPDPIPDPDPAPTSTLARVVLTPAVANVATGRTAQFAAYGRSTVGDSLPVAVTFSATGGSVTSAGLYTAGAQAGSFKVIATSNGISDTSVVTLVRALGSGGRTGLPFGPSQQLGRSGGVVAPFSMSSDAADAVNIVSRINAARAGNYTLMLSMTGGKHERYMSTIGGVQQFDERKWRSKMDTYNTPAIKAAMAQGVADGIIIGNLVMDEPHVSGGGDGNTWGPRGTMTKLRVDGMCSYVQQIFPTLPTGVFHQHDTFEPNKSYKVCDFITVQYNHRRGSVTAFRDEALALGRRDGHAIMFSLNILNGGVQDKDGNVDCAGTGGRGTFGINCRMTADQVREFGMVLGPAGCGLFMWRYDPEFVSDPENQRAFRDIGGRLATLPAKSCTRS